MQQQLSTNLSSSSHLLRTLHTPTAAAWNNPFGLNFHLQYGVLYTCTFPRSLSGMPTPLTIHANVKSNRSHSTFFLTGRISRRLHAMLWFNRTKPSLPNSWFAHLIILQDDDHGLNVCLHCFNGGCAGDRDHALLHHKRFGHPLALNIKRTRKNVQVCFNWQESSLWHFKLISHFAAAQWTSPEDLQACNCRRDGRRPLWYKYKSGLLFVLSGQCG